MTEGMTKAVRTELICAIAAREGKASDIANRFGIPVSELKAFVAANHPALEAEQRRLEQATEEPGELTPGQLDDLWITKKYERLRRLQDIADETYNGIQNGLYTNGAELAMAVREFRSYLMLAANELGQLLHRGSGESGTGDTLSVEIAGVDMEQLR